MDMKTKSLRLTQLFAMQMSEEDGDELFLMHNNKRIWPANERFFHTKDNIIPVNAEIELNEHGWVQFELFEYDHLLSSTHLGTFRMLVDDTTRVSLPYTCDLINKNKSEYAKYSLRWELMLKNQQKKSA
jgi:hypothetical protein